LTPLCLACGVLDETGPELVKLLLDSLADPNAASDIGNEYVSMCETGWQNEQLSDVGFFLLLTKKNNQNVLKTNFHLFIFSVFPRNSQV
jgi:hypothetical protein